MAKYSPYSTKDEAEEQRHWYFQSFQQPVKRDGLTVVHGEYQVALERDIENPNNVRTVLLFHTPFHDPTGVGGAFRAKSVTTGVEHRYEIVARAYGEVLLAGSNTIPAYMCFHLTCGADNWVTEL